MEKFGLFDLIDKFSEAASGKSGTNAKNSEGRAAGERGVLRTPDVEVPTQYLMNAKLAKYVEKHDALAKKIKEDSEREKSKGARQGEKQNKGDKGLK